MPTFFGFLDIGTPELLLILAIVLLLFGGKNLPKLSKSLSDSIRELRKGFSDDNHENKSATKSPPEHKDS